MNAYERKERMAITSSLGKICVRGNILKSRKVNSDVSIEEEGCGMKDQRLRGNVSKKETTKVDSH